MVEFFKKMAIGILFAGIGLLIMNALNEYVLALKITDFFRGWFGCVCYGIGTYVCEHWNDEDAKHP